MPQPETPQPKVGDGNPAGAPEGNKPPEGQPGNIVNQPKEGDEQKVPLGELLKERDKRQSLASELESLKQAMGGVPQGQPQYQPQQPYQQPQVDPRAAHLEQLWQTDPREAVRAEIAQYAQWQERVGQAVDIQESQLAEKNPDYNSYRDKVRQYLRSVPPAQRATPGVVEAAYYYVKGQNVNSIVQESNAEILRRIRAGEQVQGFEGAGGNTPPSNTPKAPTQEQLNVAAAMNMSVEDYMKNQKG